MNNSFLNFLFSAFALGITFLYGSVGEIITEKVGHLNLGIPGVMCVSAACGCWSLQWMSGAKLPAFVVVVIALLITFLGGALMGLLYSFLTVSLHANQNVTGLTITIFGVGLMKFIMSKLNAYQYLYAISYFRYPFAERSDFLRYYGVMVFLGILIAIIASLVLKSTKVGLHLRAVGENPATADAAGINVSAYKYVATCIGSGISGLGGLFYIMDYQGSQEAYLTIEALGWLSIALVIMALWKPALSILGSAVFGMLYVAGSYIPSLSFLNVGMSTTPFLKMLPYVVTILVLIVSSVRKKRENQPPSSLGQSYFREER